MAAKLSRSWSFFTSKRPQNNEYLGQDYHRPGTPQPPSTRVNLQQRFGAEGERGWRQGPLPPPPTPTSTTTTTQHSEGSERWPATTYTPAEGHHSLYTHPDQDLYAAPPQPHNNPHHLPQDRSSPSTHHGPGGPSCSQTSPSSHRLPRRPLRNLPSGVAPLWSNLQGNWSQLKPSTSKVFSDGGRKVNRALQGVRTSFSSLTQMFRSSTRRRYKLDANTPTRTTPGRTPRRTPGKLYSPFNMSTPVTPHSHRGTKRLQHSAPRRNIYGNENRGMVRTPQRCPPPRPPPPSIPYPSNSHPIQHQPSHPPQESHPSYFNDHPWPKFDSPSRQLQRDVGSVRRGMRELEQVSSSIIHQPPHHHNTWTQFR